MGEFAIGQGVPRFEDPRLLRGGGKYVDDVVLPGMAFGHVLRSPHAHAKIKSIDTSKAKAAAGVLCVLTGEDWIKSGWGDMPVPGTGRSPQPDLTQSSPVSTASTPGAALALPVSIRVILAWAWGERSTWPNAMPGSAKSSRY